MTWERVRFLIESMITFWQNAEAMITFWQNANKNQCAPALIACLERAERVSSLTH